MMMTLRIMPQSEQSWLKKNALKCKCVISKDNNCVNGTSNPCKKQLHKSSIGYRLETWPVIEFSCMFNSTEHEI